jgi:hypothetical protein
MASTGTKREKRERKSNKIHCAACGLSFTKNKRCGHLLYAQKQFNIAAKKARDLVYKAHPSADPFLRFLEERHMALPDDHDFFVFMQVYDFHDQNKEILQRLLAEVDEQLADSGNKIVFFPACYQDVRKHIVRERRKQGIVGKFTMNNNWSPYYSRLIQVLYPQYDGKWKPRQTHSRGKRAPEAHADYELGFTKAVAVVEQDEPAPIEIVVAPSPVKNVPALVAKPQATETKDAHAEWLKAVREMDGE